jgi:hypothetical protein
MSMFFHVEMNNHRKPTRVMKQERKCPKLSNVVAAAAKLEENLCRGQLYRRFFLNKYIKFKDEIYF